MKQTQWQPTNSLPGAHLQRKNFKNLMSTYVFTVNDPALLNLVIFLKTCTQFLCFS